MNCHKHPPHCKVFLILHKGPNAVGVSKFVNNHPSTLYAPLPHPFKPSSWFEILSLPVLISVAIVPVLWRPFFSLPSLFLPTLSVHPSTIFTKPTIALPASQIIQGCKPAFQGNSESWNHSSWKKSLEIT